MREAMDKMTPITKIKVSKFAINTCFDVKSKSSFCWRYFGALILKEDGKKKQVMTGQVFCKACLIDAQEDDGDVSFGMAKIKSYAKTVSTGNLNRHLRDIHDVKEEEKVSESLKEFNNAQQQLKMANASSSKSKKGSLLLAKDMAIWCCRSLIPFDSISDEGMKDFFQKYKIKEEIPPRDTVRRIALNSLYGSMLEDVKAQITADVNNHAAVTFDLWTDQYRRLNYATFMLHYLTADFEHKAFTLCTKVIDGKKTSEKIQAVFNKAMESFGLQEKKIHSVTNAGPEVKRAASLSNLDNHLCLGHALNNLITVDGIRSVTELDGFVKKCKRIAEIIQYNSPVITEKNAAENNIEFTNLLEQVSEDLDNDDKQPIAYEDEDVESETQEAINDMPDTTSPTRWHTVLALLECLAHLGNRDSLNKMLSQAGNEELIMYQREWNLLEDLIKFLSKFREVVELISQRKTAPLNLAMLFHLEIKDILNSLTDEELLIMITLKQKMVAKLEARFPVTDKIVMAAMLDPRFISLSQIDTYLERKNTTRADFLAGYIKTQSQIHTSDASVVFVACGTSSEESLLTRLSKKHSSGVSLAYEFDETEIECRKYLANATAEEFQGDDILLYWREKKSSFPMLSEVARALLAIPVASSCSEHFFFELGLTLNVKRSRLNPSCVDKVVFVHDNYKCLEN